MKLQIDVKERILELAFDFFGLQFKELSVRSLTKSESFWEQRLNDYGSFEFFSSKVRFHEVRESLHLLERELDFDLALGEFFARWLRSVEFPSGLDGDVSVFNRVSFEV